MLDHGKIVARHVLSMGMIALTVALSLQANEPTELARTQFSLPPIFDRGEAAVAEALWGEALEFFVSLDVENLDPEARAWHAFRLADLTWRHHLSAHHRDQGEAERAHQTLVRMRQELEVAEEKGRIYAEILKSLGDRVLVRKRCMDGRNQARAYYMQALDVWEESTELDLARARFFQLMAKKFSLYRYTGRPFGWDSVRFPVSRDRIEKGIRVAEDEDAQAWMAYLKAFSYCNYSAPPCR